jgi:hypothetical protein
MQKRGQITIFVILGILILGLIIGFFFLRNNSVVEELKVEDKTIETTSVKMFVEGCLEKKAEEGIYYTSLRGGYFYEPEMYNYFSLLKIPYYYHLGEDISLEKEDFEKGIADYINFFIYDCLDFEQFKSFQITNKKEFSDIEVMIYENKVGVNLDYPVIIKQGNTFKELNDFNVELNYPLGELFSKVKKYLEFQEIDPNEVMLSNLMNLSHEENFKYKLSFDKDTVFYTFLFNETKIKGNPLSFNFAIKYDWNEEYDFDLEPIPNQYAFVGEEFGYKLNAKGNSIKYYTDTYLFDITDDGMINFIPVRNSIGEYAIPILITDEEGNVDEEILKLEVIGFVE